MITRCIHTGLKRTNMKILWVDDDINSFNLRAYLDTIKDGGIDVYTIQDPDTFLEQFESIEHDCLIMDVMMPTGETLTTKETNSGFETGFKLIEIYRKSIPESRIIIFSIVPGEKAKDSSKRFNTQYKSKRNETPSEFYKFLTNENK